LVVAVRTYRTPQTPPAEKPVPPNPQALLLENLGLPEFAASTNAADAASPTEKQVGEQMMPILQLFGDGKNPENTKKAIAGLTNVVAAHADYGDAYLLRATFVLTAGGADYQALLKDIDTVIRLHASKRYRSAYPSTAGMLALKAKVHFLAGDDTAAMDDLFVAVSTHPNDMNEVFNTGGVKPEDTENPTVLHKAEFDALVSRHPDDYRPPLFRGLFYAVFNSFDEEYYVPALQDLERASRLNPRSALVRYCLGTVTQKRAFLTKAAASDISDLTGAKGGFKERVRNAALAHFTEAVVLDPTFAPAHAQIAECLYSLKRYAEAIPVYDKWIELEPGNAGAYNDRGLSKAATGDEYGAIADFSKAIALKTDKGGDMVGNSLENRAGAYLKTGNYDAAINDYGGAIGRKFASLVFLMPVTQIRAMYPELAKITDPDLLEGLRHKYFPNMKPTDFAQQYAENRKPFQEFVIAGLYVSRGDAYLRSGQFRKAAGEYVRAHTIFSSALDDRWRTFSSTPETEIAIDTMTLDFSQGNLVSLWLKVAPRQSQTYEQQNYEIDCAGRKLRTVASMSYAANGNMLRSSPEGEWQRIVPETIGEMLHSGACR
jgi:tetratricopeptide (TPR) repeat protein